MNKFEEEPFDPYVRPLDYEAIRRVQRLKRREVYLFEEIDSITVKEIIEDILIMDEDKEKRPITFYIDSPGGSVGDGFALINILQNCKCPIRMVGLGEVASMACAIYTVGTRGLRLIGENTWFLFHPVMVGVRDDYIKFQKSRILQGEEIEKVYDDIILSHSEIPREIYRKAKDTELWLPPKKLLEYKIADEIYIRQT